MNIIIGLGSNLGDRLAYLQAALAALHCVPRMKVLASSPVYETPPWGDAGVLEPMPAYLNACVLLRTELPLAAVLGVCLGIESALGRRRDAAQPYAARTIDLDLLFAGQAEQVLRCHEAYLTVPHPRLALRAFALKPAIAVWPHPQLLAWMTQPAVQAELADVLEFAGVL